VPDDKKRLNTKIDTNIDINRAPRGLSTTVQWLRGFNQNLEVKVSQKFYFQALYRPGEGVCKERSTHYTQDV
jgi:hypothetical protein